jgi:hypothetical protein
MKNDRRWCPGGEAGGDRDEGGGFWEHENRRTQTDRQTDRQTVLNNFMWPVEHLRAQPHQKQVQSMPVEDGEQL